ncbi:hypothetical protein CHS0354_018590 [Potamilus streckersoni]|uniref:Uncharacterized protein n=1 Tax=Potamilus streckersoni TaxID=2493646 RepID=A0AAE0TFL5_9BIVA|nr:hypothetical protein CHS0354_018590 [Potamilus streckersoni]
MRKRFMYRKCKKGSEDMFAESFVSFAGSKSHSPSLVSDDNEVQYTKIDLDNMAGRFHDTLGNLNPMHENSNDAYELVSDDNEVQYTKIDLDNMAGRFHDTLGNLNPMHENSNGAYEETDSESDDEMIETTEQW